MFGKATDYTINGTQFNNVKEYASTCDPDKFIVFKRSENTTGDGFWFEGVYSNEQKNEVANFYYGYGYEIYAMTVAEFFAKAE